MILTREARRKAGLYAPRECSEEERHKISERFSRKFRISSPEGIVYKGSNVSNFCKEHLLPRSSIHRMIASGGKITFRGWTGRYID